MKRWTSLMVLLLCTVSVLAQGQRASTLKNAKTAQMRQAKAAWPTFYVTFRKAIRSHDLVLCNLS
jgi:hypothetical protein